MRPSIKRRIFFALQRILRRVLRLLYRFEAHNTGVLAAPGPVLLIPNHVSWLDWLFLAVCLDPDWRFVTSSVTAQISRLHRFVMANRFTYPIDIASPYAAKHMAGFLAAGGRLVLFAEGRISVTGTLMKLFEGTGFLLHRTSADVITCYIRGAERLALPLVRHKGWTRWFPKVSLHFSEASRAPDVREAGAALARKRLTRWLRDRMTEQQFEIELAFGPATPLAAVFQTARQRPRARVLGDASRQTLTGRQLVIGARLLGDFWKRTLPESSHGRVGVLLPNINAAPIAIASLWRAGRIPAVLNFSSGAAAMLQCARLAGLRQIITSQSFLERARLDLQPLAGAGIEFLFLEEIRRRISSAQKIAVWLSEIMRVDGAAEAADPHDAAVILFTSGSEGEPKGVELSHGNLLANVRQMLAVIDVEDHDSLFNALPVFHSFGLTVGTLLPLVRGIFVFLYPSPLHYRIIPEAVYEHGSAIMLGTNTFLNGYARKAHPYNFRSVRYLFAGAEKVQENTALVWSREFGVRILEGYGATECSPCVAVNTPFYAKFGTAGRLLPGMECQLQPVEGVAEGGRLLVRGPNVMRGYLNAEANARFKALGGWYDTGDLASVDDEKFVRILGRMKRFAKVSGEMVSLTAVEEALAGAFPQFGLRCEVAVLSQPDSDKGEVLVAATNEGRLTLESIRQRLKSKGFTNLAMPRQLKIVREIPKLGTGKINHRQLEQELAGSR